MTRKNQSIANCQMINEIGNHKQSFTTSLPPLPFAPLHISFLSPQDSQVHGLYWAIIICSTIFQVEARSGAFFSTFWL